MSSDLFNLYFRQNRRNYCIEDTHKDGTPKGVLDVFREHGKWTGPKGAGKRTDLLEVVEKLKTAASWSAVLDEPELYESRAKYPRFVKEQYEHERSKKRKVLKADYAKLYVWQDALIRLWKGEPKKREIFWIWSNESGTGKSTFKDICRQDHGLTILDGVTSMRDLLDAYRNMDNVDIIWFDFARTETEAPPDRYQHHALWLLEKLSNQTTHTATKYNAASISVVAHIVVTSNEPPPQGHLGERCHEVQASKDPVPTPPRSPDLEITQNQEEMLPMSDDDIAPSDFMAYRNEAEKKKDLERIEDENRRQRQLKRMREETLDISEDEAERIWQEVLAAEEENSSD